MYKLMREKKYEQRGLKSPNMKLEERLKRGAANQSARMRARYETG